VLLIIIAFGFTGCGGEPFTSEESPPPVPEGPKYAELVESTPCFVAHWPMNESAGETIAAAVGPPNIDGVYMPGAVPGSPGALANKEPMANFAPSLDGMGGYVEVPFTPLLNVQDGFPFSVEVWVKPAAAVPAGTEQIVISSHHTAAGGNQRGYEIALIDTGALHATVRGRVFWTDAPGVTNVDITPAQGDPLEWRHIVLTHNGGGPAGNKLGLYVSVGGVAGTTYNEQPNAEYREVQAGGGERPLRFGAGHLQTGEPEKFFKGFIDEVAYYNCALGLGDVEKHFQAF
jgi:Concanavalin A-like lectin/glucanases superfamily